MFQKGELVIYGNYGICRVDEIGIPSISLADDKTLYYTLAPLFHSGVIYVPIDTSVYMRPILSKEQAEELIEQIPEIQEESITGQDVRALGEKYKGFLSTHQCEDLVRLIKTIYTKEKIMTAKGKKLAKTEQDYGKLAKEMLHRELSLALDIPYEKVQLYITDRIKKMAK